MLFLMSVVFMVTLDHLTELSPDEWFLFIVAALICLKKDLHS